MEDRWIDETEVPEGVELLVDGDGRYFFIAKDGNPVFVKKTVGGPPVAREELTGASDEEFDGKEREEVNDEELKNMDPVTRSRILASRMTVEERLRKLEDEHATLLSEFGILSNRIQYLQNRG